MRYLDRLPGTYALVRQATHTFCNPIWIGKNGRIGSMSVRRGYYVYVGSAFGEGGVRSRLCHHLDRDGAVHWNIDFLKTFTRFVGLWFTLDPSKRECEWAEIIGRLPGAVAPLRRFGSNDCKRHPHLFFFRTRPPFPVFISRVHTAIPGHARVHQLDDAAVERLPYLLDVERSERRARGSRRCSWPLVGDGFATLTGQKQ